MIYWQYRQDTDCYECRRSGAVVPADQFRPAFPTDVQIDAYMNRGLEFWSFDRGINHWERLDGKTLSGGCVLANPTPALFLTDHYLDYLLAKGQNHDTSRTETN